MRTLTVLIACALALGSLTLAVPSALAGWNPPPDPEQVVQGVKSALRPHTHFACRELRGVQQEFVGRAIVPCPVGSP